MNFASLAHDNTRILAGLVCNMPLTLCILALQVLFPCVKNGHAKFTLCAATWTYDSCGEKKSHIIMRELLSHEFSNHNGFRVETASTQKVVLVFVILKCVRVVHTGVADRNMKRLKSSLQRSWNLHGSEKQVYSTSLQAIREQVRCTQVAMNCLHCIQVFLGH